MQVSFVAPDIECGGCASSIETALTRMSGVQVVEVDIETKGVSVTFDSKRTTPATISKTLTEIGFPPKSA